MDKDDRQKIDDIHTAVVLLSSDMKRLVGEGGVKGKCDRHGSRLSRLEAWRNYVVGFSAGGAFLYGIYKTYTHLGGS